VVFGSGSGSGSGWQSVAREVSRLTCLAGGWAGIVVV